MTRPPSDGMATELKEAIDSVYAAFAAVPRPREIEGCPCCIEDKEVDVLLAKPLREISPEELSSYASSVFLTIGCEKDFHYFLPRILEVTVTDLGWWPDIEVTGRALENAKWLTWPEAEREAIKRFFDAQFSGLLTESVGSELDSWLCGISLAGLELAPFLTRLEANTSAVLEIYGWNANPIMERRLTNGFWDDTSKGASQLIEWFYSTDVSLMILKAYGVDLNKPRPDLQP